MGCFWSSDKGGAEVPEGSPLLRGGGPDPPLHLTEEDEQKIATMELSVENQIYHIEHECMPGLLARIGDALDKGDEQTARTMAALLKIEYERRDALRRLQAMAVSVECRLRGKGVDNTTLKNMQELWGIMRHYRSSDGDNVLDENADRLHEEIGEVAERQEDMYALVQVGDNAEVDEDFYKRVKAEALARRDGTPVSTAPGASTTAKEAALATAAEMDTAPAAPTRDLGRSGGAGDEAAAPATETEVGCSWQTDPTETDSDQEVREETKSREVESA